MCFVNNFCEIKALTGKQEARAGRLDPVIGRDEAILHLTSKNSEYVDEFVRDLTWQNDFIDTFCEIKPLKKTFQTLSVR